MNEKHPKTPRAVTDRTDKSPLAPPFGGFVSDPLTGFHPISGPAVHRHPSVAGRGATPREESDHDDQD
jgi:hypothetical protein